MPRTLSALLCSCLILCCAAACCVAELPFSPPTAQEIEERVAGLQFLEFLDVSYQCYLLWFPEHIVWSGAAAYLDVRNDRVHDFSQERYKSVQDIESAILRLLRQYDRSALPDEQKLFYDAYEWSWQVELDRRLTGFPEWTPASLARGATASLNTLTVWHPFYDEADVDDFMARVRQIPDQLSTILDEMRHAHEAGVRSTVTESSNARAEIRRFLEAGYSNRVYIALSQGMRNVESIATSVRQAHATELLRLLSEEIQPALRTISSLLLEWAPESFKEPSLLQYPGGAEAYANLLRMKTQCTLSPEEVHALAVRDLERIAEDTAEEAHNLGLHFGSSPLEVFDQLPSLVPTISGASNVVAEFSRLTQRAHMQLGDGFHEYDLPEVRFSMRDDIYFRFVPASLDGRRTAEIRPMQATTSDTFYLHWLVYHEGLPGHYLQWAVADSRDLPLFVSLLYQPLSYHWGYTEGWARYAEQLASELGWYEDDYGLMRALLNQYNDMCALAVSTGIHALGWTREDVEEFCSTHLAGQRGTGADYYISRSLSSATFGYALGGYQMRALRDRAEQALGFRFDLRDYHDVVLRHGIIPMHLLERVIDDYISTTLAE